MANFESFSEDLVPRITPRPVLIPALDNSKPIVPEVSIIFDEIKLESEEPKSYKQWRDQQRTPAAPVNYGEMIDAKKKFVKFDCLDVSDIEQPRQMIPTHSPVPFNGVSAANTSTNKTMNKIASNQFNVVSQSTKTIHAASNDAVVSMRKPIVTMEDMYKLMSLQQKTMEAKETRCTSNAQSRMPSNETAAQTEITLNDILQLLLRAQQPKQQPDMSQQRDISNTIPIDAVDDQTNAKRVSVINEVQMASAADDEPSLRDLFRIIVKQQEQLINIQQQVQAILVQNNSRLPYNDCHRPICDAHNSFNAAPNPMGVMTSLEINVQKYSHNTKSPSDRKLTPSSNAAVLQCCSNCKSPLTQNPSENNIFVATPANRQNSPNSKPNNANDWTFYGNILNQVNHVLQNSPPANVDSNRSFHTNDQRSHQNHPDPSSPSSSSSSASPNCNNFVTSAQFQQIGLKFDDVNVSATSKRVMFDTTVTGTKRLQPLPFDHSTTTNKSVIMNALAMKYLPIENRQSSPIHASPPPPNQVTLQRKQTATPTTNAAAFDATHRTQINSPSNMSISSYRYMEKYGLL